MRLVLFTLFILVVAVTLSNCSGESERKEKCEALGGKILNVKGQGAKCAVEIDL